MERRLFMKSALAGASLPLLTQFALGQDKKPITFWYESASPENQDSLKKLLIDPFNAAHPDSELSIDFRGSDLDKQMRIAMLSGSGPDIVFTAGPSYVAAMAQAGQLLALDDYAQKLGWNDRVLPLFMDLGRYNGKLYALAKTYETLGLFYNKTLFAKNGWTEPKTIADLDALAAEAAKAGMTAFAAGNADWRPTNEHYVSIVLNSIAGPENVYKALTGAIPWTDPSIVAAIDKLGDPSKDFYVTVSPENLDKIDTDANVWLGATEPGTQKTVEALPLYPQMNATVKGGQIWSTDGVFEGAFSFASPLSIPYTLDTLVPRLEAAFDGDPATLPEPIAAAS